MNVEPGAAVARSVTVAPRSKPDVQRVPQSMPEGSLRTVPVPLPALTTVRRTPAAVKSAVTVRSASMTTVQGPVPEHPAPLQPPNVDPAAGWAVSTTVVPAS